MNACKGSRSRGRAGRGEPASLVLKAAGSVNCCSSSSVSYPELPPTAREGERERESEREKRERVCVYATATARERPRQ